MFRDDYTNFSFNEQDSSSFKVWITNKNDLKRNMSPNFSDKFNSPTYGQIRYHEGTTIDKQDFKFSCVAVNVTLTEWRAITEWLSPLVSGKLRFDWNEKYYYMVKLSKAPSGTMFMKSKIDNVMGQLYIINFDIEFTTVNDWAALGEYGEQKIEAHGIKNIDPSVFNNEFYTPSVILKTSKIATYSWGDVIFPCDEIVADISSPDIPEYIPIGYIYSYDSPGKDPIAQLEKTEYGMVIHWFYRNGLENYEVNQHLYASTSGVSFTIQKNSYLIFDYGIGDITITVIDYEEALLANFGTLDTYLYFAISGSTSVVINNEEKYAYETVISGANELVNIDTRYASMSHYGLPLELSRNDKHLPIFNEETIVNNGIVSLKSGRPELLKVYLEEYKEEENFVQLTFLLNNNTLYDRYNDFILHIFDKDFVLKTNKYNKDPYGSNLYSSLFDEDSCHKILNTPLITIEKHEGGYKMVLKFTNQNSLSKYNTKNFNNTDEGKYFYIAICDINKCQIHSSKYTIGMQNRSVI